MGFAFLIRTVLELAVAALILYGVYNEKKLIAFEHRVIRIIKKKIKLYRRRKAAEKRRAQNINRTATQPCRPKTVRKQVRRAPSYSTGYVA